MSIIIIIIIIIAVIIPIIIIIYFLFVLPDSTLDSSLEQVLVVSRRTSD